MLVAMKDVERWGELVTKLVNYSAHNYLIRCIRLYDELDYEQ
jgi:hypothetical protein